MDREDEPKEVPPDVIDAAFEEGPIPRPKARPSPSNVPAQAPPPLPPEGTIPYPTQDGKPPPPFKDYLRDLQEEFEEQQEEGKL